MIRFFFGFLIGMAIAQGRFLSALVMIAAFAALEFADHRLAKLEAATEAKIEAGGKQE